MSILSYCTICKNKSIPLGVVNLSTSLNISQHLSTSLNISQHLSTSYYSFCEKCDFAYNANPPSQDNLEAYYQGHTQFRRKTVTTEERNHIASQVLFLKENLSVNKQNLNVLEIGPDNGSFLDALKADLRTDILAFDEFNSTAKEILASKGYTDRSMIEKKIKFNIIVLRHVLEHIPYPLEYMLNLREALDEETGTILIEVPDYSAIGIRLTDDFQFEHVSYFSIVSISEIAKRSGFTVDAVSITRTPGYSTTPNHVLRCLLKKTTKINYNSYEDWAKRIKETNELIINLEDFLHKNSNLRIAVYGAGTVTQALVVRGCGGFKITSIYDMDDNKVGMEILGTKVVQANSLSPNDFDLIISTVVGYEKEVFEFLRKKNVNPQKIISLSMFSNKK